MQLMTISQYAKSRNISDKMVRRLINEGKLPAGRVGRKYLLNVDAVDASFEKLTGKMKTALPAVRRPPRRKKQNVLDFYEERRKEIMEKAYAQSNIKII